MKKIVLTGGGTAGHVTPHLAILPKLKQEYEIHYIGSNGIEKDIIKKYPFIKYHEISAVKLIRSLTPKNLLIPFKLLKSINESKKIIKQIQPNIVFSKGGFVAVPVVMAAHKLKVPVISHESDITMGLANKIILKMCKVMCCTFKSTCKISKKCLYTGTPIRQELFNGNAETANKVCKFKNLQRPCVLIMGGSLGAKYINQIVLKALPELVKTYNVIHIVGKNNLSNTKLEGYCELEYVNDIEHYLKLANFVVSRAGANSINEFLALKKPMLLIPLPTTQSRGDQILNAKEFEKNNYCIVLQQENLTPQTLLSELKKLQQNEKQFIQTLSNANVPNGTNAILQLIKQYAK